MKRREILKRGGIVVAAAVTGPFFHVRPARADKGDLIVVSWGGDYDQALRDFVFPAFEKATGYTVKLDAPPETAKVKAVERTSLLRPALDHAARHRQSRRDVMKSDSHP